MIKTQRPQRMELVPVRISFDELLKQNADKEIESWNISMSELCRSSLRYFLNLSVKEKRDILFPMPK